MKRKLIGLLVLQILLPSCCLFTSYDKPTIYKAGYSPGVSNKLRTDGFYYSINSGRDNPRFVGYVHPIFFYSDGSVAYCSSYESIPALLADLPNASCRVWGFYRVDDNRMRFEIAVPADGFSSGCHVGLSVITATLENDGMKLVEERDPKGRLTESSDYIKRQYRFYPYDVKPDPRNNWIRDNKHYKLVTTQVGIPCHQFDDGPDSGKTKAGFFAGLRRPHVVPCEPWLGSWWSKDGN